MKEKIAALEEDKQHVLSRKIVGCVLAPDYNTPPEDHLKINGHCYKFMNLSYSTVYNWLKENAESELRNDMNFKAFHDTMKRLTYEHENESLYEEMKETFFARINELLSKKAL